jgi:hypothetical protein
MKFIGAVSAACEPAVSMLTSDGVVVVVVEPVPVVVDPEPVVVAPPEPSSPPPQ